MRKLTIIMVAIFVALVLIIGGVGGYLWYSTKQQVDQMIMMVKPFAEVGYGGITVSPGGSVGVTRLRIMPNFINDTITVGAIRLNAPNLLALLNIRRQLQKGQLPESLSISIHQLELSLQGDILGAKSAKSKKSTPFDNLEALGCGPVVQFGVAEWQGMGYGELVSDMEIGYHLDTANNVLNLRIDGSTRGWATMKLDIGFATTTTPTASLLTLAGSLTPKLARMNLVFRDDGFNARKNNYCAAKAGKPVNEYIADHVRLLVERLRANGIEPGPGLIEAYQRYLTEGGEIVITATPPVPINPAEVSSYTAEDVVKLLILKVSVNGKPVTDLSANWDIAKVKQALDTSQMEEQNKVAPPAIPQPVVINKTYHPIPVSELSRHIGKIVKLKTTTGVQYQGLLESVAEGFVNIKIKKSGGNATLSLRPSELGSAEVLY